MERVEKKDKMKITIIVLSILVAISLSVTIYFASFYASRAGAVTLNFADGLTMRLTPNGNSGRIQITSADESAATFSYAPQNQVTQHLIYDGFTVTINKEAYVSFQISLWETTSGTTELVSGSWGNPNNQGIIAFYPSGVNNDWIWTITLNSDLSFTYQKSNGSLSCIGTTIWAGQGLSANLFETMYIRNSSWSNRQYIDDLAGRSFEMRITIKASTTSAPTFS